MTERLRRAFHRLGFDVSRYPAGTDYGVRLKGLLEAERVDCVLDVGAFVGEWAEALRRLGYAGQIVSYEPAASSFASLAERAAGDALWTARRAAVAEAPGRASLRLASHPVNNSLLPARSPNVVVVGEDEVGVVRLEDDWPGGRVFLKVDTQGMDLGVIRGCGSRLEDVRGLQLELSLLLMYEGQADYLDVLAELRSAGFGVVALYPFLWDDNGLLMECDCLLRRI